MTKDSAEPESISAITLAVADMETSVEFYRSLGFGLVYGAPNATFTSLSVGGGYVNLQLSPRRDHSGWGRVIFYVTDVDAFHERALGAGHTPEFAPRDADWGERYFHLVDPDGHELSFARPLSSA